MKTVLVVLSLLFVVGCAAHREFGRPIDPQTITEMKQGVTTKDEVRTKLGKPFSVSQNEKGETIWTYAYSVFDSHRVPTPFSKGEYSMSSKTATITFDPEGKFQHYILSVHGDDQ